MFFLVYIRLKIGAKSSAKVQYIYDICKLFCKIFYYLDNKVIQNKNANHSL